MLWGEAERQRLLLDPDPGTWRHSARENWSWWETHGARMCQEFVAWKRGPVGSRLQVATLAGGHAMVELELQAVLGRVLVLVLATLDVLYFDEHGNAVLVDHKTGKGPYTGRTRRRAAAWHLRRAAAEPVRSEWTRHRRVEQERIPPSVALEQVQRLAAAGAVVSTFTG